MNENPDNPVNPVQETAPIRDSRGLSKLAGFSDRQLEHINAWLDEGVAYRKIAEFCLSEFLKEVPHMTIARYANRSVARTLTADLTDSKEAAAEISHYAATGDATFSTNTLELLEQKAFDLAAVYQRDNDAADLKTLTQLTSIINKARNTKVRERHATVQEQKLELRREELALKRELASKKCGGTSSGSPLPLRATRPVQPTRPQQTQTLPSPSRAEGWVRGLRPLQPMAHEPTQKIPPPPLTPNQKPKIRNQKSKIPRLSSVSPRPTRSRSRSSSKTVATPKNSSPASSIQTPAKNFPTPNPKPATAHLPVENPAASRHACHRATEMRDKGKHFFARAGTWRSGMVGRVTQLRDLR